MKKTLILSFALIISINGFGKNIIDIFYLIPPELVLHKSIEERNKLVDYYLSETVRIKENDRFPTSPEKLIKIIDVENGFLEMYDGGEGYIEISYWNLDNNENLIAINHVACATFEGTVKLTFYKLTSDNNLTELNTDNVMPYKEIHNKFLKIGLSESDKKMITESGILSSENIVLELPRNGKEIKVKFGWDSIDNKNKLIVETNCLLTWENYRLRIKE